MDKELIVILNSLARAKSQLDRSIAVIEAFLDEERGAPSAEEEARADFASRGECPRFPETDLS